MYEVENCFNVSLPFNQVRLSRVFIPLRSLRMEPFDTRKGVFILIFCIFCPSLDQFTDIKMVTRLMEGPEDDSQIKSGEFFII